MLNGGKKNESSHKDSNLGGWIQSPESRKKQDQLQMKEQGSSILTLTNYIIRAARAEREGAQRKGAPANQLTILYDHIVSLRAEFKEYGSF